MGQEPVILNMNPATSSRSNTRASGYHQKALAEIRNSLLPFANGGGASSNDNYSSAASTISTISTTSGVSSASGLSSNSNGIDISQIISMGYTECSAGCTAAVAQRRASSI
ncbi:Serine/threonine-protein kinase lats1 [Sarracenia purpurea var. burkii]